MSAITDDEIAASLLCASVPQHPDCMQCRLLARIRADAATEHQFVVKVMDKAKGCGLERLGILHGR